MHISILHVIAANHRARRLPARLTEHHDASLTLLNVPDGAVATHTCMLDPAGHLSHDTKPDHGLPVLLSPSSLLPAELDFQCACAPGLANRDAVGSSLYVFTATDVSYGAAARRARRTPAHHKTHTTVSRPAHGRRLSEARASLAHKKPANSGSAPSTRAAAWPQPVQC